MKHRNSANAASHQNVTVTVPEDLLIEARHLAVDRGMSLSRFIAMLIEERIDSAHRYTEARERQRRALSQGFDLETQGTIDWERDQLHER